MSEAIELVIRDLLLAEGNSDRVAKSLVKRLKSAAPNRKERIGFVHFLIQCGYYREVLELYLEWLKEVLSMPLYPFYFLLHQSGFRPGEEFIRQIFNGQDSAQPENKISSFINWEAHDSRFIELKQVHVSKLLEDQKQRKLRHFEKLEYLRDNRMLGEEEKFLDELIYLYPEEEKLVIDKKNFKERWARSILASKQINSPDDTKEQIDPIFSEDEKLVAKTLVSEALSLAKKKPDLAYNLAISLYFLDLFTDAYNVLKFSPQSLSSDWLQIELLLKSRRYVECLDSCLTIETRYANNPETVFGTTYYRAQSLFGLGQTPTAIELLRSLVAIRPSYRSAHSLLLKWGG